MMTPEALDEQPDAERELPSSSILLGCVYSIIWRVGPVAQSATSGIAPLAGEPL
jgi:hypothetical protein